MPDETTSVRITQQTIYQELREVKETQIKILERVENLADVPERVRRVEIELARLAWIEKIAYTGLSAGVVAIIGMLLNTLLQ